MQKWKIMLDFGLFAVKSMKFSLTRFSKIQVYLFHDKCLTRELTAAEVETLIKFMHFAKIFNQGIVYFFFARYMG